MLSTEGWHVVVAIGLGYAGVVVAKRVSPLWGVALLAAVAGFWVFKEYYLDLILEGQQFPAATVDLYFLEGGTAAGAAIGILPEVPWGLAAAIAALGLSLVLWLAGVY